MNRPRDFEIARDEGWYRLPERQMLRDACFEYVAFYFTAAFGDLKWAVHYYARCLGHELARRRDLLPAEPDHLHADKVYYKLQLGPLSKREPPIPSRRWRRVTFIHTTWDRFSAAEELNDLYAEGDEFVDRVYHALRDAGLPPERCYPIREAGVTYIADLAVLCRDGVVGIDVGDAQVDPTAGLLFTADAVLADLRACLQIVQAEVDRRDGVRPYPD
ncbi:MAG: hypothetical protein JXA93_21505 [Anaerolineae bacterium]|nr:hypothetical protein [Anaerolineae bacterium]